MQDELRESLAELRAEVHRADVSDAATKAKLEALIAGIEAKLERPDEEEHGETLLDHARELVGRLGTEYPRAASIINRILVSLGGAGI